MRRILQMLILFLPVPIALLAAAVPRISFDELVTGSEWIVHGTVRESWTEWDRTQQFIWTHYRVDVHDRLKGHGETSIVISEPGGRVGNREQYYSGMMNFATGEEVVLFLYRTPVGYLRVTGHGQGKYVVDRTGNARPDIRGLELVDLSSKTQPRWNASTANDDESVEQLKTRIRAMIRAAGGRL